MESKLPMFSCFLLFQRRAFTPPSDFSPDTSVIEKKKKKKKRDTDNGTVEDITIKAEPEDKSVNAVS